VSRIGRMPVVIPDGVEVSVDGSTVRVKGPKGEMTQTFRPEITIKLEEGVLKVERPSDAPRMRALHGFEKVLQVEGVGYRPEMDGQDLILHVGYSHPVRITPPEGISFEADTRARLIKVQGIDKAMVGQVAADIRKVRPPEPYKGKGIRYQGEYVRRKAGKAGKVMA